MKKLDQELEELQESQKPMRMIFSDGRRAFGRIGSYIDAEDNNRRYWTLNGGPGDKIERVVFTARDIRSIDTSLGDTIFMATTR